MWTSSLEFHPYPRPKSSKLITVYILMLILSISFISCQRSSFKHQVDSRTSSFVKKGHVEFLKRLQDELNSKELQGHVHAVFLASDPEINPFWYVGRGVRPIGRFGKRQLKFGQKRLRPVCCSSDLILTALQEQAAAQHERW